jgi:hypothetical protein
MAPRSMIKGAFLGALALTAPVTAQLADQVSSDSQAGVPLFTSETLQLTDDALATVNENQSALFQFGNASSLSTRSVNGCKVYPGDFWWPSKLVWNLFDAFLGGALIKTVPLAASCYKSWPDEYNAATCSSITDDWTDSNLQ